MTTKKLAATAALLLGATLAMSTTSFAQAFYDVAPGFGDAPGFYDEGISPPNCDRGGPGPRVSCGSGMGIGSQR
ncbi:MAG TPA: hypothetical protein VMF12_05175 [Xanthobacteraceae bacterium]|nr:hypothetical protein [Xanthobacteraceae bacterium]